ncbi:predicted protein [Botrytis cinerea T4]|uniref:Uncharacterized protein n=1 Tax=Botryotinia fuckeliana (strain T4) TaxID=999810 RepID=G2XYS7_BOTF4|nr:predicted protein [Botrytis cinerea T4]
MGRFFDVPVLIGIDWHAHHLNPLIKIHAEAVYSVVWYGLVR